MTRPHWSTIEPVALVAVDVPVVALVVGIVILIITTAVSALSLPELTFRRRRNVHLHFPPSVPRRVVTGRPAALPRTSADTDRIVAPPIALPPAPSAPVDPYPPSARRDALLDDAEAVIEHLIDNDPDLLADLFTRWINSDRRTVGPPIRRP